MCYVRLISQVNFTQVNWTWSPASIFSLRSPWDHAFVKMTLLVVSGGLALATGPATALQVLVLVPWVCQRIVLFD